MVDIDFLMKGNKMAKREILLRNGTSFEFKVMNDVITEFPEAKIYHDVKYYSTYLQQETQVDLLIITSTGVFMIEAKNWKNWVAGTYDDFFWYGRSRESKTLKVHNIVMQNLIHIRELRNILRVRGYEPPVFHNIVVFPDGTELRTECSEVINLSKLHRTMNKVQDTVDVKELTRNLEVVFNE